MAGIIVGQPDAGQQSLRPSILVPRSHALQSAARPKLSTRENGGIAMSLVWFLLIGLAAGWLAGQVLKGGGFGLVGDLIVGVIGALLGGFLFSLLGISTTGLLGSLITATVGAIVLLLLLRLIKRR
jgi:uncharacterized membrane protein YeaQ/YmgE (transglycosylase-associated protein family)